MNTNEKMMKHEDQSLLQPGPRYAKICHPCHNLLDSATSDVRLFGHAMVCITCGRSGNSKFEASNVKACRICLATDVKMYSLQDTHLTICMEAIAGFNKSIIGFPNYICYQCAPCFIKCYKLIEKSKASEVILQDIFARNRKITTTLIEKQRTQLKLQSSLDSYLLLNYFCIKYDDYNNTSEFINTESDPTEQINIKLKNQQKDQSSNNKKELQEIITESIDIKVNKIESDEDELNDNTNSDDDVEEIKVEIPLIEVLSDDETDALIKFTAHVKKEKLDKCSGGGLISQKFQPGAKEERYSLKRNRMEDTASDRVPNNACLTTEYTDIQEYFNIVKISLHEQIEEWRKSTVQKTPLTGKKNKCCVCHKMFANAESLRVHADLHNTRIHGIVRCGVCLLCFSTTDAMKDHSERTHSNKYYCKFCPKHFINIDDAKEHTNLQCFEAIRYRKRFWNAADLPNVRPVPLLSLPFVRPEMWGGWRRRN